MNARGGSWVSLQSEDGDCVFRSDDGAFLFDFRVDDIAQVNENQKTKELAVTFARDDANMGQDDQVSSAKFRISCRT